MEKIVAKYALRAAPRYTSYPTAPHFRPEFPADTYRGWLEALPASEPISLYVHIPFCRQMCWYCGCNMKLARRDDPMRTYVDALLQEIAIIARSLPGRLPVAHLHFGGGTPTALPVDQMDRIFQGIHRWFDLSPDAEIAAETDPRSLAPEMVRRLGALGLTRVSIGVQEFDPAVQAAINRLQPPDMVRGAVEAFRAEGVRGVNFDLIYGLPRQTVDSLRRTIDVCTEIGPDRLALFGYAHVPWMAKNQRMIDAAELPGASARTQQAAQAADALAARGFEAIGVDHFARPSDPLAQAARDGTLRRNFQGYTTDGAQTLIGFGATAISRTASGYAQNITETGAWSRAIAAGAPPVARGRALSREDQLRGEVIERLMCDGAVDVDAISDRHGAPVGWWDDARAQLDALAADGVIERRNGRIALTRGAKPLARIVASAFDTYLQASNAKHSVAV